MSEYKNYSITALTEYFSVSPATIKMYLCRADFAHTKLTHIGVVEVVKYVKEEDIRQLKYLLRRSRQKWGKRLKVFEN